MAEAEKEHKMIKTAKATLRGIVILKVLSKLGFSPKFLWKHKKTVIDIGSFLWVQKWNIAILVAGYKIAKWGAGVTATGIIIYG